MRRFWIALLTFSLLLPLSAVNAEVSVAVGPTTIPRGDATGARDITIQNDRFAVAIAVDTAPPWGVARGGIVDIALLRNGAPDYDIASLADFMPNNWSSWPTTYQRVSIEENSTELAVVRTKRDWGAVELETTFAVRDGDSKVHIITRMTNKGETSLDGLLSGYVVWPDGGYLIGEPVVSDSGDEDAPGGWTAAYDEHWLLGLHAPFSDHSARRGRDRYTLHDLRPGETKTFEAWLQIESDGTLAPMLQTEIEFRGLPSGRVSGRVSSADGERVRRPAVVVSKDGNPIAWTLGNDGDYEISLPVGSYELYATASGYARGALQTVAVTASSASRTDFNDVRPPGEIRTKVTDEQTGRALDAKLSIKEGYRPLIGYFGKDVFFTELDTVGVTSERIAPGNYVFEVSAGSGFTSMPRTIAVEVKPGQTRELAAAIAVIAKPQERGWYSADLHHHSDVLDGFTEAEYVLRSELAAGVDIAFLSDHDSVINNREMQLLAKARGVPFIPGTELSASWAHFNAYPLDDGHTVDIDTGQATVQEIFATARRMGADIIEVNHPYSEYGYFSSHEKNAVPGGYDPGFDLVEIGPIVDNKNEATRNRETLERVWRMWNQGQKAYLAAGSDVHDVWNFASARARTYVHVDGDLTIEKFVAGLKAGHSFASQGPLVYPQILFGSDVQQSAGDEFELSYSVQAVSGLRSIRLIERGNEIEALVFDGISNLVPVTFSAHPVADTWYSLVVEDTHGGFAYTNPVWVSVEP
ncbi:MAG: CehA/McbA family metallohydrolase [Gammaproteobacteria bacterium]|nr:CehA/McbA family metallohydrolase [Gammaproteobacteria bacterium]